MAERREGGLARPPLRVGEVPWTAAVGVWGWVLSLGAAFVAGPLVMLALLAAGLEQEEVGFWLLPVTPAITGVVALLVARSQGSARALWGRGWPGLGALVGAAALGAAAFAVFNIGLGALVVYALDALGLEPPEVQQGLRKAAGTPEALPMLVLSTTVAAPFGEELLYRGLLYQGLLRRFGPGAAMVLSALAFGLGHATIGVAWLSNTVLVLLIVPLGIVLAWSFRRWGSLWVPIVIHSVFNAITVLLMVSGLV